MSIENKFVPMSESNTQRIRTSVTLPFQLHERVGLNLRRMHVLCQVAGFRFMSLGNDPRGETSQSVPQIVGIDRDGSAIAGKVALRHVPTYQSAFSYNDSSIEVVKQARWKNLSILINTEEMQQRILLSDGRVTDSQEWGKQLDSALKSAMVINGARHLIKDITRWEQIKALLFYSFVPYLRLLSLVRGKADLQGFPLFASLFFVLWGTMMTPLESFYYGVERSGEGRRISLFYGPELDRAVALLALTYTSRLAKGIAEDK